MRDYKRVLLAGFRGLDKNLMKVIIGSFVVKTVSKEGNVLETGKNEINPSPYFFSKFA